MKQLFERREANFYVSKSLKQALCHHLKAGLIAGINSLRDRRLFSIATSLSSKDIDC